MGKSDILNSARLRVRVQPRARKDEIIGVLPDGRLKIRLKAPPVDGKANTALVKFLAETVNLPKSQIRILSGQKNREKLVEFEGVSQEIVDRRIRGLIESGG